MNAEPGHVWTTDEGLVPVWQRRVWVACSGALLLVIFVLLLLVGVALWKIMSLLEQKTTDLAFIFSGMALVTASLLRLLAILIGGAIAFVGLAVSFFAHQKATSLASDIGHEQVNAKAALATNSPGIVAVVIGACVIIFALLSKGTHSYFPGRIVGEGIVAPEPPMVPPAIDDLLGKPASGTNDVDEVKP